MSRALGIEEYRGRTMGLNKIGLKELREEYLATVSRPRVAEEVVHQFLVDYPVFLPISWPYQNTVFSKLHLGSQHATDFCHIRVDSPGAKWHLIEIEKPGDRLFTKSGNPSSKLTHAMKQLYDWESWFIEERDYVLRHFPHKTLMNEHGLIPESELQLVIGRRSELGDNERKLMQRLTSRPIMIMTFDRLAEQVSWPACETEETLRTCRFAGGEIETISAMKMNVSFSVCPSPAFRS